MSTAKKRITILATGGTIACVGTQTGLIPGLTGKEIIARLPQLSDIGTIEARQIMNLDSSDLQVADWRTIARSVKRAVEQSDGVVITHGTDTMCYTAAALSFMMSDLSVPVVLTGAQKPLVNEDSDAVDNLLDACRVASFGQPGVCIVFNHKIIHGSRAFKMFSENFDAYVSRNYPILGHIERDQVIYDHQPKNHTGDVPLFTGLCEDVMLLKLMPATSPAILDYISRDAYQGVVIEGYGAGGISNLTRGMATGIRHLTRDLNIPVVMISQCPYDGINMAVYGIGDQASEAGVISGNDMTTEAAVVKLMWVLGQTKDPDEVRQLLSRNVCDEFTPRGAGNQPLRPKFPDLMEGQRI